MEETVEGSLPSAAEMGSSASVALDPQGVLLSSLFDGIRPDGSSGAHVERNQRFTVGTSAGEVGLRKVPTSRYKGVVPQANGRWGAQIYERNQRVWLGIFAEEAEAARAYDVAALCFRGSNSVTNFKPLSESREDEGGAAQLVQAFLAAHSKAEIVEMLRKRTFHDRLQQIKLQGSGGPGGRRPTPSYFDQSAREMLFDKAVTPSDVGKQNRLVIPKKDAEKHFPLRSGTAAASKGVVLNFEDATGKMWRFRYSYWLSSHSYVITKGWIQFVKEKSLRAGDVVSFWRSTEPAKQLLRYIEWKPGGHAADQEINICREEAPPASQVVRLFGVDMSVILEEDEDEGRRLI